MKIRQVADLADICRELKHEGQRIVHCHGCFDLLHPGHVDHLQEAKRLGGNSGVLIVTLTADEYVKKQKGPTRPAYNAQVRAKMLAALECVDYVAVNSHATAVSAIEMLKPDIYAKGSEYSGSAGDILAEKEAVELVGGKLAFTETPTMSSSAILNEHFGDEVYSPMANAFLGTFRASHSLSDVHKMIDGLSDLRVLVLGEAIIDIYTYVELLDKAPKTNILAMKHLKGTGAESHMAGGAVYLANTVAGFCESVTLVTCLGTKGHTKNQTIQAELFLRSRLASTVQLQAWCVTDRPPIIKQRYIVADFPEQVHSEVRAEICYIDDSPVSLQVENEMISYIESCMDSFDIAVIVDYGHGLISKRLASRLDRCKFLAVNTQANESNYGYNTINAKYQRVDYACIGSVELRLAMRDKHESVPVLLEALAKQLKCKTMAVTLGPEGSVVYSPATGFGTVPVFSKDVRDRIGAGDTFLALTSLCAAKGCRNEVIGFLGNCIGALACQKIGTGELVTKSELVDFLGSLLK